MTSNNRNLASLQTVPQKSSRRRTGFSRREREKSVLVELTDDQGNNILFDHFELSSTGLFLHSDYLLCPGDQVKLGLRLSTCDEPLEVQGEVIRSETGNDGLRPGMSIVFKSMPRNDRSELERFLIRRIVAHAG